MNTVPITLALLVLASMPFVSVHAQEASPQPRIESLLTSVQAAGADTDSQSNAAWELGLAGPGANQAVPALIRVMTRADASPKARVSALNALGHIGVTDQQLVEQITRAIKDSPNVFRGAGGASIVNGSFESIAPENLGAKETGAFGETMFPPGSLDLAGWMTYKGILMLQNEGARPGGKNSLELGPRDVPGCASQTVQTSPGEGYAVRFYACTGRNFAGSNRQLRLRVADVDQTIDCVVGATSELVTVPFTATSALTTITFCGLGTSGFGPMIDEVTVEPAAGLGRDASSARPSRVQQLDEMAQRLRQGLQSPGPNPPRSTPTPAAPDQPAAGEVALLTADGRAYVGHQLEFFEMVEPGVVGTTKPAWIHLYQTEGREFVLEGEVTLGGADETMLFPGDLPDGLALFLREWDGMQRYQLDSRRVTVKRRLLHGQRTPDIIQIVDFAPPAVQGWIPFKVHASENLIEYTFAGTVARLPGPVDTDGANKIVIAPGTRLRNLRLAVVSPTGAPGRSRPLPAPIPLPGSRALGHREENTPMPPGLRPSRPVPLAGQRQDLGLHHAAPALAAPPDGEYRIHLEWWKAKQSVRMRIKNGAAEIIESSEPKLQGTTGNFRPLEDGVFYIFLASPKESFGGQIWEPQPDGSFEIKEIPDRGEEQKATLSSQ